ncbi:putative membrane protein YfcC [Parelusimicrobium proximum]|uniref:YfcC family protein n=1 Tax=Parelusimicrobium proximum TaxID=3228953 RepID=UPI003D16F16E
MKINIYALIFTIILVVAALTWVITPGKYDKAERDGRMYTVAGSYHTVERNAQGLGDIFTAPAKGFVDCASIIIFIFITGAIFTIIEHTGAIGAAVNGAASFFSRHPSYKFLFIPVCMTMFSVGGATFGMEEETLIFIPVFIPLALSLGYDSVVGVSIPFLGAWAGFCSAFMNPFTVGISQSFAELPMYSGIGYRLIVWVICTAVIIAFVAWYGYRVLKNPESSITYDSDEEKKQFLNLASASPVKSGVTRSHELVGFTFFIGMIVLVIGVAKFSWGIVEISGLFLGMGLLCAVFGRLTVNQTTDAIIQGARSMVGVAIMLALARGIVVVADAGNILDTILHFIAGLIGHTHSLVAAIGMFFAHTFINFFIASGSGQAVLTMPIMLPLGDLVGVSRQLTILAYQFGEGWGNAIIPTAPVTMAAIGLAGISWAKWAKWIWKLQIILIFVSIALLIPPYITGW